MLTFLELNGYRVQASDPELVDWIPRPRRRHNAGTARGTIAELGNMRIVEQFTVSGGQIIRLRQIHDSAALRAPT
jgi:hypothetical protein